MLSIMEYLSDLVKRSNTHVSQLRNACYKVLSEFVMKLLANVLVFGKFARHLCNTTDDNDMQPVIYNLNPWTSPQSSSTHRSCAGPAS